MLNVVFWETPEPVAPVKRIVNMPEAFRSVNEFEILKKLGEGTYGVVYKGRIKKTGEIVALKKVKMDNHRRGVKYLHDNLVLHRDLKTSNLLLNRRGELKICDLGMARKYGSLAKPYTQLVVTLWYRAPELLLGAKQYSTAVDMWSVGCIIAELLLNQPLFNGDNEIKQIDKIFRMLGTPNETSWPGFSELPEAKARFVKQPDNLLRKKFHAEYFAEYFMPTLEHTCGCNII
ncbi:hypothetical protein POM88_022378 [Heracleum sosnowskyi]|uniref:Protein kinase domain-containing protein n=1 Tax=Heracleum sosnowskyi TaxID=360622 RepID=A0AAD8IHL8_9APIA|nr:hypothetical protein POM88_022378 [Heracleum sosnowskyi]